MTRRKFCFEKSYQKKHFGIHFILSINLFQVWNWTCSRFSRFEANYHGKIFLLQHFQRFSMSNQIGITFFATLFGKKQRPKSSIHKSKRLWAAQTILSSVQHEILSNDWHRLWMVLKANHLNRFQPLRHGSDSKFSCSICKWSIRTKSVRNFFSRMKRSIILHMYLWRIF